MHDANRSFAKIAVLIATVVFLLASATVLLVASDDRPSFRRGGQFVAAEQALEAPATTGVPVFWATTTSSAPPPTTSRPVPITARPARVTASPAAAAPAPPPAPLVPAAGTYRWAVTGSESATAFGSRPLPPQMTMVVHGGGLGPRHMVADLAYSPDHTEREILEFRDDGIYMSFEGGEIRFGLGSQTNQGDYSPPMLQVPLPASPGVVRTGSSEVRDGGGVQRVEDWTVRVVGEETLTIGGASVRTTRVTVDRQSRPGSAQRVTRSRTYWFDPGRQLWVKYTERVHGEQGIGVLSFSYDAELSATLSSFTPG